MNYIERKIQTNLLSAIQTFPAVVITGARQVGKTTLLRHLLPHYHYVSLDRPANAEQAEVDPEAFLRQHPEPLLLDEVQYAPRLFRFLKIKIDEQRERKGRFVLTGSQKFSLMKGVSESLAGRIAVFELEGLSCLELKESGVITNFQEVLDNLLLRGGFPELWQPSSPDFELFLDSYIATYLERDVKQVLAVGSLRDFERFLRACALRSGQQLNKSDLARDIGISVPTVGEWLSVLEALGQIVLLEPWFGNLNKRMVKSPKLYMADAAMMSALCGINLANLWQSPLLGFLWETYVFSELRKQTLHSNLKNKFWYYRDNTQAEVDFVAERGHELHLFECKWTSEPGAEFTKGLKRVAAVFAANGSELHQVKSKTLITRSDVAYQNADIRYNSPFTGTLLAT